MDRVITWIFLAFGMLAALDRIFGNRLGLGKEFEKGMMMLGTLTLSMTGMLTIAPLIAEGLSILSENIPLFFDFSILPASLLANDMGGAHLAAQLASDAQVGVFNGLVVSSMMGCTVSFTLPFVLQTTDDSIRKDVFFGLLCGIVTIPIGCLIAGLLAGFSILDLLCNLLPLLLLAALISLCLLKFERITIRVFFCIGVGIKAIVTVGLVVAVVEYLTGVALLPVMSPLDETMGIIVNIACVMVGAFPCLCLLRKTLRRPLMAFASRFGINDASAFGFLSTLGTSVTTFENMKDMDRKGIVLNSAFAVSASFALIDHLAFTMSYHSAYVPYVLVGKLVSGISALVLAFLLCKKRMKNRGVTEG